MKLFKSKMLQWWEIGVIKFAVLCIGIAVGAHWYPFFFVHAKIILLVGLAAGLYALYFWLKD
jgi:hypothetical protein